MEVQEVGGKRRQEHSPADGAEWDLASYRSKRNHPQGDRVSSQCSYRYIHFFSIISKDSKS